MTTAEARASLSGAAVRAGPPSSDYDLNSGVALPEGRVLRPASVLIGVLERRGRAEVVLTKRSSRLKHHPGQIAFPGGKVDAEDTDAAAAALREADEEIGLEQGHVDILGTLPAHETVTGFSVTPVLGWISHTFEPRPEAGEVDEVFFAPLSYLMDRSHFVIESRHWRGHFRHYYAVPWGPYYIWGATARILRGLADRMAA